MCKLCSVEQNRCKCDKSVWKNLASLESPSTQLPTATYRFPQQALKSRPLLSALHGKGPDNSLFPTSHFALRPGTLGQGTGPLGPKLGGWYPGRRVLFPLRSVSCDITLHDTAPHQHNDPPRVGGLGPATSSNTPLATTGLKEPTPTKFSEKGTISS